MGFWKAVTNWKSRKEKSDLRRVRVTSSGAFYMKSEDLFNDKIESLALLKKLNESVDKYKKSSSKTYAST